MNESGLLARELDDLSDFAPSAEMRKLFVPPADDPRVLLMLQLTYLRCCGVVLGTSMQHAVLDARSACHFIETWAGIARGSGDPIVPPFLDRTLLRARSPLSVTYDHVRVQARPCADTVERVLRLHRCRPHPHEEAGGRVQGAVRTHGRVSVPGDRGARLAVHVRDARAGAGRGDAALHDDRHAQSPRTSYLAPMERRCRRLAVLCAHLRPTQLSASLCSGGDSAVAAPAEEEVSEEKGCVFCAIVRGEIIVKHRDKGQGYYRHFACSVSPVVL